MITPKIERNVDIEFAHGKHYIYRGTHKDSSEFYIIVDVYNRRNPFISQYYRTPKLMCFLKTDVEILKVG